MGEGGLSPVDANSTEQFLHTRLRDRLVDSESALDVVETGVISSAFSPDVTGISTSSCPVFAR